MLKIKTIETISESIAKDIERIGLITMTAATLSGLAELPSFISTHGSVFRTESAVLNPISTTNSPWLREKDEFGQHYSSYTVMRTAPRSRGK